MEFLASDAMRGRGSATHDELVAATYIASELRAYGIEPAGDSGGYLQRHVGEAQAHGPSANNVQRSEWHKRQLELWQGVPRFSFGAGKFLSSVATSGYRQGGTRSGAGCNHIGPGKRP